MAAAPLFPLGVLAYDHNTGTIDIPNAHNFNAHFGMMGTANAAAGTKDYPIKLLQMLAFSLNRRNPANAAELDALFVGVNNINEAAIFQSISTAVTAGFAHRVTATGNIVEDGFKIVRSAQIWAQTNATRLYSLMAADFYVLPVLAGNPIRFRMSFSFFQEQGGFLTASNARC